MEEIFRDNEINLLEISIKGLQKGTECAKEETKT